MRTLVRWTLPLALLALVALVVSRSPARDEDGPVFDGIRQIAVLRGPERTELEGRAFDRAAACLATARPIRPEDVDPDVLGPIVLLEVDDVHGVRWFGVPTRYDLYLPASGHFHARCLWTDVLDRSPAPGPFDRIHGVTLHWQAADGVAKRRFRDAEVRAAAQCLAETVEIDARDADPDLVQAVVLVEVEDALGDRMFEFYTRRNFSGNKGRHYRSPCFWEGFVARD